MKQNNETYKAEVICWNCGHREEIEVPKGITIEDYLYGEEHSCSNCKCNRRTL